MKTFLLILLLLASGSISAHPISISWATLHASKEKIGLQLNILAEDLFLYQGMEADSNGFFSVKQLLEAAEQHKEFLGRYFFLEDLECRRLPSKFLRLQFSGIPTGGIHKDSLMQYSLLYFFEFKTQLPLSGIQAHQQFGGNRSPIPALVMATAYQEGAGNSLTAELSRERPWVLHFNWENPELFARKKGFTRFNQEKGPSASIRIDEKGILQELVLSLEKLETLLPLKRKEPSYFSAVEEQQVQQEAIAFFTNRIKVMANGKPVALSSAEVVFGESPQPTDMTAPSLSLLPDTPVKISLVYSTGPALSSVSINWEVFNWQARRWNAKIQSFGKTESHTFSRYQQEYFWAR